MKRLLIVAALGAAAYAAMQYFIIHAGPGLSVAQLFLDAGMMVKMVMLVLLLVSMLTVLLGIVSLFDRSGATRKFLQLASWAAPAFGALGMAYGVVTIMAGLKAVGPGVDSRVWAPGAAEALLPLVLGLWVAFIAAVFLLKKPAPASA